MATATSIEPWDNAGTATSQRVLNAAARLFRQRGYGSTKMRDVAELAGMQAGSIYYHYPSKQLLLKAVLDQAIDGLYSRTMPLLVDDDPAISDRERFRRAVRMHIMVVVEMGDYSMVFRRLLGELPTDLRKDYARKRYLLDLQWRDLLSRIAARGGKKGELDLSFLRMLMMGAINSTSEWYDPERGTLDRIVDIVTEMVFDRLHPPEAGIPAAAAVSVQGSAAIGQGVDPHDDAQPARPVPSLPVAVAQDPPAGR